MSRRRAATACHCTVRPTATDAARCCAKLSYGPRRLRRPPRRTGHRRPRRPSGRLPFGPPWWLRERLGAPTTVRRASCCLLRRAVRGASTATRLGVWRGDDITMCPRDPRFPPALRQPPWPGSGLPAASCGPRGLQRTLPFCRLSLARAQSPRIPALRGSAMVASIDCYYLRTQQGGRHLHEGQRSVQARRPRRPRDRGRTQDQGS